jgi:hypothetical protein
VGIQLRYTGFEPVFGTVVYLSDFQFPRFGFAAATSGVVICSWMANASFPRCRSLSNGSVR